jgi:hypothetical protein
MLADEARSLPLSKKTGLAICHFASANWQSLWRMRRIRHLPIRFSELANTPHSPKANAEIKASYCEIF